MAAPIGFIVVFPEDRAVRASQLVEELGRRGANVTWQPWDARNPDDPNGMIRDGHASAFVATTVLERVERNELVHAYASTLSTEDCGRIAGATAKYAVRATNFELSALVRLVAEVLAATSGGVSLSVTKL